MTDNLDDLRAEMLARYALLLDAGRAVGSAVSGRSVHATILESSLHQVELARELFADAALAYCAAALAAREPGCCGD